MKNFFALITMLLISNVTYAQQTVLVVTTDEKPLAGATVSAGANLAVATNNKGIAKISMHADSAIITYTGFEKANVKLNATGNTKVILQRDEKLLPLVTVFNCKNMQRQRVVYDRQNSARCFSGVGNQGTKYAILIENPAGKPGKLESIQFWISEPHGAPDSVIGLPLYFSFYRYNKKDSLPGELLTTEEIKYVPTKMGKQTIEMKSFDILIPENGIIICVQALAEDWAKYRWEDYFQLTQPDGSIKGTIMERFGVSIEGVCDNQQPAFYSSSRTNWEWKKNKLTWGYRLKVKGVFCD